MTPDQRAKRIAEIEKDLELYRKMGGAWGGLSRVAKEAEKTTAGDPAKLRRLVREAQGFLDRLASVLGVKPKPAKGETVLRFEIGQPQELSAGLVGWRADVQVIFQDDFEVDADVAEAIRSTLADCADGYCRTQADVEAEAEADRKALP